MTPEHATRLEDLDCFCGNCHRLEGGWRTLADVRAEVARPGGGAGTREADRLGQAHRAFRMATFTDSTGLVRSRPMNVTDVAPYVANLGLSWVGAVVAAWASFRFLGKRWIEDKFARELETFKHAKNREIEELRGEVNALLDRTVKLHAKEFEVLPEAWEKLSKAYGAARQVANRGQQVPSVQWLHSEGLEVVLNKTPLEDHEQKEIKDLPIGFERQTRFNAMWYRHQLLEAFQVLKMSHNYLISKGLFIQPELKDKFYRLGLMIREAVDERQLDDEFPKPGAEGRWEKADILSGIGAALYREIERDVQARLWERKLLPERLEG